MNMIYVAAEGTTPVSHTSLRKPIYDTKTKTEEEYSEQKALQRKELHKIGEEVDDFKSNKTLVKRKNRASIRKVSTGKNKHQMSSSKS